jgi:hypothetical protein
MRYLSRIPRKLPQGQVLVHNRVQPASPIGMNGFRIWRQSLADKPKLTICKCGWAPQAGVHYRVEKIER